MAMRAKSLVGVVESLLAELVASNCPQLQAEQFVIACAQQSTQPAASICESLQQGARGIKCAAEIHCMLCRSLWAKMQETSQEFPDGRLALCKRCITHALVDAEAAHDPGAELRALLVTRVILEIEGLVTFSNGKLVWDPHARDVQWCSLASGRLRPLEARFDKRMDHMQRNTFVTRSLLGCPVVVDPVATYDVYRHSANLH